MTDKTFNPSTISMYFPAHRLHGEMIAGGIFAEAVSRYGGWPVDESRLQYIKQGKAAECGIVDLSSTGRSLFFKRFPTPGLIAALRSFLGFDRAHVNWRMSRALKSAGIPVPAPEAFAIGKNVVWYFSEFLRGWQDLSERTAKGILVNETLAQKAINIIAHLHEAGFIHGDLKWSNLMIAPSGQEICFSDLDSVRQQRVGLHRAGTDLARFLVNGLERGQSPTWARMATDYYGQQRGIPSSALITAMRDPVNTLSRRHQRDYGRAVVPDPVNW